MTEQPTLLCTDLCEHCTYAECGDFICDITNDATIVDWKPFPCSCIEKRREGKGRLNNDSTGAS